MSRTKDTTMNNDHFDDIEYGKWAGEQTRLLQEDCAGLIIAVSRFMMNPPAGRDEFIEALAKMSVRAAMNVGILQSYGRHGKYQEAHDKLLERAVQEIDEAVWNVKRRSEGDKDVKYN